MPHLRGHGPSRISRFGRCFAHAKSKKILGISAVVLKWSRSRKRYERQGLLVETSAIEKAEAECLQDADIRERRRQREAERREVIGRVGRSAAAKSLDENAINLAVQAHIRHTETNYDEL